MALSCEQVADLADELALDALTGDRRALALEHLERCATCRGIVEALSEVADQLLFATRAVEAPLGFEGRVLARMAAENPAAGRITSRRRPRRALLLVAAAAAVLALAAGIGSVTARNGGRDATVVAAGYELRTVQLISTSGQAVGDVSAYAGNPAWFFMRVNRGIRSATYECVVDVDGGQSIPLGTLAVVDGKGAWGQHLGIDAQHVRAARLVDASGAPVATALFH